MSVYTPAPYPALTRQQNPGMMGKQIPEEFRVITGKSFLAGHTAFVPEEHKIFDLSELWAEATKRHEDDPDYAHFYKKILPAIGWTLPEEPNKFFPDVVANRFLFTKTGNRLLVQAVAGLAALDGGVLAELFVDNNGAKGRHLVTSVAAQVALLEGRAFLSALNNAYHSKESTNNLFTAADAALSAEDVRISMYGDTESFGAAVQTNGTHLALNTIGSVSIAIDRLLASAAPVEIIRMCDEVRERAVAAGSNVMVIASGSFDTASAATLAPNGGMEIHIFVNSADPLGSFYKDAAEKFEKKPPSAEDLRDMVLKAAAIARSEERKSMGVVNNAAHAYLGAHLGLAANGGYVNSELMTRHQRVMWGTQGVYPAAGIQGYTPNNGIQGYAFPGEGTAVHLQGIYTTPESGRYGAPDMTSRVY